MKREDIKAKIPDITPEALDWIMSVNGTDIEKAKAKATALEAELNEKNEAFGKLNTEFEKLKAQNAAGDDWKAKFEALQAENDAKEKQAQAEKISREKSENVSKRFESVVGDREFNHPAIRADFLKRFGEALESSDNVGKSDTDIFHALTKDDATAFKGVSGIRIAGGNPSRGGGQYKSKEDVMAIKDRAERRRVIAENPSLFGIEKGE